MREIVLKPEPLQKAQYEQRKERKSHRANPSPLLHWSWWSIFALTEKEEICVNNISRALPLPPYLYCVLIKYKIVPSTDTAFAYSSPDSWNNSCVLSTRPRKLIFLSLHYCINSLTGTCCSGGTKAAVNWDWKKIYWGKRGLLQGIKPTGVNPEAKILCRSGFSPAKRKDG